MVAPSEIILSSVPAQASRSCRFEKDRSISWHSLQALSASALPGLSGNWANAAAAENASAGASLMLDRKTECIQITITTTKIHLAAGSREAAAHGRSNRVAAVP